MYRLFSSYRMKAFGLIETSLALLILGLIVMLSVRLSHMRLQSTSIEHKRHMSAYIHQTVLTFIKAHGILPCPSRSEHGRAQQQCLSTPIISGDLPFSTLGILGLSRKERYTYILKTAYTKPRATLSTTHHGQVALPVHNIAHVRVWEKESHSSLIDDHTQTIAAVIIPQNVSYEETHHPDGSLTLLILARYSRDVIVILDQNFPR